MRLFRRREPKTTRELAALGEEHAARYLASRGYRIRERNFRLGKGPEIDIIAEHRDVLVFVEVKARTSSNVLQAREAVTPGKERQIARAAATYLGLRERRERVTRFDIVEVYLTPDGRPERIEIIEGAFKAR